jgi:hypothetical protein
LPITSFLTVHILASPTVRFNARKSLCNFFGTSFAIETKKGGYMFRIFLTMLTVCATISSFAQQTNSLAPDQNPNYMVSQLKYTNQKDSLLNYSNTTSQETYKAYDWREAREERRTERRSYRREASYLNGYYSQPVINYGHSNYGYGYNNSYNNYYNRNRWGISRPFIGFRTGNWWFGF